MRSDLTDKEYAVLMASLIYSIDRHANTMGHFDAYHHKAPVAHQFQMRMIGAESYNGVEIYQEDANQLARTIDVDLTYLDPPITRVNTAVSIMYMKTWCSGRNRSFSERP